MRSNSSSPPRAPRTSWGALLGWLLFIGLTAAGLRNALAPEPGLEAQARLVACSASSAFVVTAEPAATPATSAARPVKSQTAPPPPPRPQPCVLQLTRYEQGPLGRNFEFQESASTAPVRVQCWRQYWALGDYRCTPVR